MGIRQLRTRREFLKLGGAAVVVALFDVSRLWSPRHALAATRSQWTISAGLPEAGSFETPPLYPEGPFNAIDVSWLADDRTSAITVTVRTSDGMQWSEWTALQRDSHARDAADARTYSAPLLQRGVALQVHVEAEDGAGLRELTIGAVDTTRRAGKEPEAAPELIDGFIIPRAGWGADEALRHVDQDLSKPILWVPEYQQVEKLIVHHTATENDPADAAAAVRAIYYFHAVTRGWGDIGYNFLIDWQGKVYEGRFGGPNVVGGHALQYNYGSMGIALIGDFTDTEPPSSAIDSLIRLIEQRAPQIDISTASNFVDLGNVPNLCGHGDLMPTACPGDDAHALLPDIRGRIAGTGPIVLAPPVLLEAVEVLGCEIGPSTVYQGNMLEIRLHISNPSISTIPSQDPPPGYVYEEGQDFVSQGFPKLDSRYRFGLDFGGRKGTANPYRWGFGEPLEPGQERVVTGYVRLHKLRTTTYTVSIVKEYVRYVMDHDFPQAIVVAAPPIAPTAQSSDDTVRYFSETGHNVPALFARYWDAYGGLYRFGYPLTEAFEEVSETDGGRYLTQYFERARFEFHPEYAGTKDEVLLGLLGSELTRERLDETPFKPVASPSDASGETLWFAETGHTLGSRFRDFWEADGGLPIFGYPISEEFRERSATDGKKYVVQYFERNRFEYHPEYEGTEYEVLLGHLARELLIQRGWLQQPRG